MPVQDKVRTLLDEAGTSYASEAGIKLADKPSPLYRLVVLSVLLSTRIKADIAVHAARELAPWNSPQKMFDATWQQRVDALGGAGYRRYDESTATALGQGAELLIDRYHGDLRRLRAKADGDPEEVRTLLVELPRLGPVGADIFCREAQLVWPELRPSFDSKALSGAKKLGLPTDPDELAGLVEGHDLARLAAALVRSTLQRGVAPAVR
ncbi:endonuclease [Saccharopolyspora rhizosphaerae]|uniref:Endonuclease n=1 Tax=Saccharopolyspora rhizosphaerae TaxID=2492662 RepID=A0A3R8NX52_9PSEU|nr:endonuclease [Saccharopolyspora rhizosphaerae]RRO15165.1 endonuclease [Saccharopolyspora rhizosphaerae]